MFLFSAAWSVLGIPAGFIGAGLLFGGGMGPWIGVTVYGVHLLLFAAFRVFVHRAAKAERARGDNPAAAESGEPPAPWRRPF